MSRFVVLFLLSGLFFISCNNTRDHSSNLFHVKKVADGYDLKILTSDHYQVFHLTRDYKKNAIHIPVSRVVVFSSTHVGFICALGQQDRIVGVADTSYICCADLRKRFNHLTIVGDEIAPDLEKIIALKPDVVFISGYSTQNEERFARLQRAGIAVIPVFEYRETDPLQRAEWIKVFGVFFDTYRQATQVYSSVVNKYNDLKDRLSAYLATARLDSPVVLVNIPYRGVWYVPGGQSYIVHFIKDAGAKYPWEKTRSSSSIPLSFEQVFNRAQNADILINPNTATTIKQILAVDSRLDKFRSIKTAKVYNFTRQKRGMCFAFWEKGVIEPHRILSDLINIFYPQNTFASDTMFYYQKLN